ncbi:MAG TPA: hypothetical protein VK167_02305 [Flavipsychrobacter sp.]|nr:hypothetical protein [Flavipsychrobacter sp.]
MSIPAFSKDKLCFVLNTIAELPSRYKDAVCEKGYVLLSGKTMQKWIGRDYKRYIDMLIKAGIIESDGSYIVGSKPMGYRFCEAYKVECKRVLVTDSGLISKMNSHNWYEDDKEDIEDDKSADSYPQYSSAIKCYNSGLIKIDYKLANLYNETVYAYKKRNRDLWDSEIVAGGVRYKNPYTQYLASQISIDKIHRGRFNPSYDTNVYRLHSVITQCKREIRNAITIDGKLVAAVDISNCQPTLLTILMNPEFWDEKNIFNYTQISYLGIKNMFNTHKHYTRFIMMCKNAEHNSNMKAEVERFNKLVESGTFYNNFRSLLERKLGLKRLSTQDVKTMFFTVLFTSNRFIHQKEAACKRVFREWFPQIYELTRMLKVKDHANLPILLQRLESYLLFNRVIPSINAKAPNLSFIPIHDSIAVPVGHEKLVQDIMTKELSLCLGFKPHLKVELWEPENLERIINEFKCNNMAA